MLLVCGMVLFYGLIRRNPFILTIKIDEQYNAEDVMTYNQSYKHQFIDIWLIILIKLLRLNKALYKKKTIISSSSSSIFIIYNKEI